MAQGALVAVNAEREREALRNIPRCHGFRCAAQHVLCSAPCGASLPGPLVSWCSRARCSSPRAQTRASELNLRAKVAPRATPAAACKASVRACRSGASNRARLHVSPSPHAATRRLPRGQRAPGRRLARAVAPSTPVHLSWQTAARTSTPKRETFPTLASMRVPRPAPAFKQIAPGVAARSLATIRVHFRGLRALRLPPPLLPPLPRTAVSRVTAAVLRASVGRVPCPPSGSP